MGIFRGTKRQKVIVVSGHKPSFVAAHPALSFYIACALVIFFLVVLD